MTLNTDEFKNLSTLKPQDSNRQMALKQKANSAQENRQCTMSKINLTPVSTDKIVFMDQNKQVESLKNQLELKRLSIEIKKSNSKGSVMWKPLNRAKSE